MAFVTKTWKDRLVEYAGRRKLKNVATGEEVLMDVSRSEGTVSQAGDAFSAANMNNLEQRIKKEFDTVNSSLVSDIYVGDDGNLHKVQGGADTVLPFSSGASGTLTIGFNFEVRMNTQDGTYGNRANNNGTATIKLKDGVVTSQNITGSGWGATVSAAGVAYRANVSSFSITSVNWTPD